nr:glycosyltransferase [Oecophyllibacter saccharovorans]
MAKTQADQPRRKPVSRRDKVLFSAGVLSLLSWFVLLFCNGKFWYGGPWLKENLQASPKETRWPDVVVIVPARDEAASVSASVASLLAQDYPGAFRVVLVDDESTDETAKLARTLPDPDKRLTVLHGAVRPAGWSGKLWAVQQGQEEAFEWLSDEGMVLLTDADIVHAPDHLTTLVRRARQDRLDLISEMVRLNVGGFWEKALVPAFVYFFAMLYPFRKIADPTSPVGGAAGGTVLLRRVMLEKIGGIASLRDALIDDCTLGARVKQAGGRLYLGCSEQAWSIRAYQRPEEIWHMIARNAYVQLHYSPWRLFGVLLAMMLVWVLPVSLLLFGRGRKRGLGALVYGLSCLSFVPTLRWFNLSLWRVLPLPLVACFYLMATLGSAADHYRGRGVQWRGRSYAEGTSQELHPHS